jgi:hypothetical protein
VTDNAVTLLSEPGPVRLHVTPREAVIASVWPCSIVCGEEGDRLTEIGGEEDEPPHPPINIVIATTHSIMQQAHNRDMAVLHKKFVFCRV